MVLGIVLLALLTLIAFGIASCFPAHAGSNACYGTVRVDAKWFTVVDDKGFSVDDTAHPYNCRTLINSRAGRRLLAICPNKSKCAVAFSVNPADDTGTWDSSSNMLTFTKFVEAQIEHQDANR